MLNFWLSRKDEKNINFNLASVSSENRQSQNSFAVARRDYVTEKGLVKLYG